MRSKRYILILLLLFSFSLLMASPIKENGVQLDSLSEIQGRGEVIFAVEKDCFPWAYRDSKNRLTGFCIEVAKCIAEELGSKAKFVEVESIKLWSGLENGDYDMGISIYDTYTAADGEVNPFENTYKYFLMKAAVVARNDNTTINDPLDLWDRYVVTPVDPVYIKLANRYKAFCVGIINTDEMFSLVESKNMEAAICSIEDITKYLRDNMDSPLEIVTATKELSGSLSFHLRKGEGSSDMKRSVNRAILKLKRNGTLAKLSLKYLGYDFLSQPEDNDQ
ncbi:MAG: transporter substrate-binding domain-containing protein [Sphaerochaetaceae bacterium]|nr:transporter substrate-binding domain-containing protein [Sphaerochaetaceae bacterium]